MERGRGWRAIERWSRKDGGAGDGGEREGQREGESERESERESLMDKGLQPQYRGQMNLSPLVLRLCPFPPPSPPPAPLPPPPPRQRERNRERERRKAKSKTALALCCTSYCCLPHSAPTSHLIVLLTPDYSLLTSYFLLVACPSSLTFSLSTTELRDPMFPACGQELEACPGSQGVPTNSADPPNDMLRPIRPLPSVGLSRSLAHLVSLSLFSLHSSLF